MSVRGRKNLTYTAGIQDFVCTSLYIMLVHLVFPVAAQETREPEVRLQTTFWGARRNQVLPVAHQTMIGSGFIQVDVTLVCAAHTESDPSD